MEFIYRRSCETLIVQRNFAPVSELGEAINVNSIEGEILDDFSAGVYIRNGSNPLSGGLKSTKSIFGSSSHTWIEGEGMLHAIYIDKDSDGRWIVRYNNIHVETKTYKQEKQRNKPSFLPAIEGDPLAIFVNLRFGAMNKLISNINVFEQGGKFYLIAENHIPQEINIFTLETLGNWNADRHWNHPFTSHPKRALGTRELVIMGVDAVKAFMELGIISDDMKKLIHKADLKLDRCSLCLEIGVTQRLALIQFNKKDYARIGTMPHYGDGCTFHIRNCFEDGDEVVVRGCKTLESIIRGPDFGLDKFQCNFTGLKNRCGYTQVVDSSASSISGMPKYGGLAKLYLDQLRIGISSKENQFEDAIKLEYHEFGENIFCNGAAFVLSENGSKEDDG
ncbi:hypothetical protein ACJRO7_015661 [Eucalyptus globulus]|uniref:Uncharacterized protein n=1 Tax=Eucalyptus globulus TaxID=34317 RepID=A0ABD3L832_EUCGL